MIYNYKHYTHVHTDRYFRFSTMWYKERHAFHITLVTVKSFLSCSMSSNFRTTTSSSWFVHIILCKRFSHIFWVYPKDRNCDSFVIFFEKFALIHYWAAFLTQLLGHFFQILKVHHCIGLIVAYYKNLCEEALLVLLLIIKSL